MSEHYCENEAAMAQFAHQFAPCLQPGMVVYLQGQLGAGKTTLVRQILRALGYENKVKSPTYTLVESYDIAGATLHHFDLYRLSHPEELEYLGIRDYINGQAICLIEWAEKGKGLLPPADITCYIDLRLPGRCLKLTTHTQRGKKCIVE